MVHQELAYCPDLTVAENLSLGRYPRRWRVLLDRTAMVGRAREMLTDIAPELNPSQVMRDLSVAQVGMVQIAAAVNSGATMLVFDEHHQLALRTRGTAVVCTHTASQGTGRHDPLCLAPHGGSALVMRQD